MPSPISIGNLMTEPSIQWESMALPPSGNKVNRGLKIRSGLGGSGARGIVDIHAQYIKKLPNLCYVVV
jgi:hypothetical protein